MLLEQIVNRVSLEPGVTGDSSGFNPNAFIQPLLGTYGNVGRNIPGDPSLVETDLSFREKLSTFREDEFAVPLR
jgi:hypothetical protein